MTDVAQLTVEDKFAVAINQLMAEAIQLDADPDAIAAVTANTAYELYEHYGAGEAYDSFPEFATDVAFQADEVDSWLDEQDE